MTNRHLLSAFALAAAAPAVAQTQGTPPAQEEEPWAQMPPPRTNLAGEVADSTAGQVGQRQITRGATIGVQPMARIASRIQNRVNSRIRNRIDRYYDPQGNAANPFAVAEDQTRSPGWR
jgi:hypothetical protein